MQDQEYETKVLTINKEEVIATLRQLGAEETPEFLLRKYIYNLESDNIEFIRLRTNGKKTTLTYKYKVIGNTDVGKTVEIEVEVSDFDKTAQIFSKLHFDRVCYQESKSHIFNLNGVEYSIDSWPMIEPYLEIESSNQEKVIEGLRLLGLEDKEVGDLDIVEIYKPLGINPNDYPELKF